MKFSTPNLTGRRFGYWTVIEPEDPGKHKERRYLVECQCGYATYRPGWALTGGHTMGCPRCRRYPFTINPRKAREREARSKGASG